MASAWRWVPSAEAVVSTDESEVDIPDEIIDRVVAFLRSMEASYGDGS